MVITAVALMHFLPVFIIPMVVLVLWAIAVSGGLPRQLAMERRGFGTQILITQPCTDTITMFRTVTQCVASGIELLTNLIARLIPVVGFGPPLVLTPVALRWWCF
jgi:hypothetical protein